MEEEGNAKLTRVLYKANLSYDRLVKYLDELIARGLLQEIHAEENRYYVITDMGKEFIREVKKAESFLSGFGLSL
ncbi:MAG: DUF4364 family protein [Conexivisphaerales archaeon]